MHLKVTKSTHRRAVRAKPINVRFPVPKKAISTLRALAIGRDPRLVDLGVLAVQISDDESIVLGIELEKTKRLKPLSVTNTNENSARVVSKSPIGVSFETLTRKLDTSSASGFNNHFTTTPQQRDSFSSRHVKPSQNKSTKRKAKGNLSTDGVRRKASKQLDKQMPVVAQGSTWEMVYSHLGLHGDSRRNQSIPPHIEPIAGSQASGVANVPVAQPTLSRENVTKENTRNRETSVSSPQKGSTSGIYSEDDSSVSSSPCSHSPMNEEELLNLFVDQNLSATSILRQLAEGRHKDDDKNCSPESNEPNKSKYSNKEAMDTTPRTSMDCDNVANKEYSLNTAVNAVGTSTVCSGESVSITISAAYTANANTGTLSWSTGTNSLKRPNKEEDSQSISLLNLFENSVKRQRRLLTDPESKKDVVDLLSKTGRRQLQKAPIKKSQEAPLVSASIGLPRVPNETALRNFQEYGYYYSSEDLKALGSKAITSKSTKMSSKAKAENTSSVPQVHNSASIITQPESMNTSMFGIESVSMKPSTIETVLEQPLEDQTAKSEVDGSVMSSVENVATNSRSQEASSSSTSLASISSNTPNEPCIALTTSSTPVANTTSETCSLLPTSTNVAAGTLTETCLSSASTTSTETCTSASTISVVNTKDETLTSSTSASNISTVTCSSQSTPTNSVTNPTIETCTTTSSSSTTTSSENLSSTAMIDLRRNGQYYALSYVYPMGTVWYPYVAITPYAAVGVNERKHDNDESATERLATTSQYIDLASSMRYWQQLSLLYKNKLLASTPTVPSVFVNTDNDNTVTTDTATNNANLTSQQYSTNTIMSCVSSSNVSTTSNVFPSENTMSMSVGSTDSKPTRRASVIVANNEYAKEERASSSTPESTTSSESIGSENTSSVVIDNCNRLIEEHCNRMSEVFADVSPDGNGGIRESSEASTVPSLSFIPDSSIAYVNIGSTQGTKKSGANGRDVKGKTKKKKPNKNV